MPTAETRVETTRAERYLAQLRDHLGHMGRGRVGAPHPHQGETHERPGAQQVEHGDRHGEFVFDWGRCKILGTDEALLIRAEADNEEDLKRATAMIGHRIETIGRREDLTVTWH